MGSIIKLGTDERTSAKLIMNTKINSKLVYKPYIEAYLLDGYFGSIGASHFGSSYTIFACNLKIDIGSICATYKD